MKSQELIDFGQEHLLQFESELDVDAARLFAAYRPAAQQIPWAISLRSDGLA